MRASAVGAKRLPLFDIGDEVRPVQVRLKERLLERLSRIAQRETALRQQAGGTGVVSRNDVIERVLEQFADTYEKAELESAPGAAAPTPITTRPKKK